MNVTPIATKPITESDKSLIAILDQYILDFSDGSILAITSKIVSLTEGRVVKAGSDLQQLIEQESDAYLHPEQNPYGIALTIKESMLIPNAGIDHSNGNGHWVLWPRNAQETANNIRAYLKKRFSLKKCGVIITDSKTSPLRWGVTGVAVAHSGFAALRDYRGKKDVFRQPLLVTQANIADGLAAAAVLVMGEGAEQTPIAVISEMPFVDFQDRNPTDSELQAFRISLKEDLYGPLLQSADWHKRNA